MKVQIHQVKHLKRFIRHRTLTVPCQVCMYEYWGNIWAVWSECLQMASEGSSGTRKRFIALISQALHKLENKRVSSEKWNGEGGLTRRKLPVSSNVKLIYPLIRWKTIEMSIHVIQQRAIEASRRDRQGKFTVSEEVFSLTTQIKLVMNLFLVKDTLKVNIMDFVSTSMLKLSSWAVRSYIHISFWVFVWYFCFKRWCREKKLYLIWLQHV